MDISMEVHEMTLTIDYIYNIIQEHVQKRRFFQVLSPSCYFICAQMHLMAEIQYL